MKKIIGAILFLTASQAFGQTLKIEVSSDSLKMVEMVTQHPADQVLKALWEQASLNAANQILADVIKQYDLVHQSTETVKAKK